jgi:hypothetical protein
MLRIAVFLVALTSSAFAQVTPREDHSLQEQLVPESFKLAASAASHLFVWRWLTTVSYTLKNDSGMNLNIALLDRSISIGSCTEVDDVKGALPKLHAAAARPRTVISHAAPIYPSPAFVPAGARVSGTIVIDNCEAPNPGSPKAPLSLTLLLRKSDGDQILSYPLSVDAPVRRLTN